MFNDFHGYDKNGKNLKISAPPTLLISSLGVLNDLTLAVSIDPKFPGDLIYILGETRDELGGSEYFAYQSEKVIPGDNSRSITDETLHTLPTLSFGGNSVPGNGTKNIPNGQTSPTDSFIGNYVPKVDASSAIKLYRLFRQAVEKRLISSALSTQLGGLAITLTKKAIAGQMGMEIDLCNLSASSTPRADFTLFSESQSRIIVTIDPKRQQEFEEHFANIHFALLGKITDDQNFIIKANQGSPSEIIVKTNIATLDESYRKTFKKF